MNENFVKWSENKWSNCTFMFPCVSVGNIGQLAIDLLIASVSDVKKAGQLINNRLVQPIVGYDPYNECSNDLSVSIEREFLSKSDKPNKNCMKKHGFLIILLKFMRVLV
jgi:hypothetical protein